MIKIGMMLGDRYEILEKIGTGGMSDVYKAKDHKLNRFVAVKVLKQEFSENTNFVSKFRVEAQAAASLMHPNIVNVYDVGEDAGVHYIVMELVEGITLKKYIEKKARLSVKEAVSIAIQACMGLEAAHNNHIIHRDIKPQNIIISKEGKVKVTDFGIAKAATSNTITSNVMGSVHYTSPEQARGGYSDERSDIYSMGITLFEMLTGKLPFDGDTPVAVAIKQMQVEAQKPRDLNPDIPQGLEEIVIRAMKKDPDLRYQTAAQMRVALENLEGKKRQMKKSAKITIAAVCAAVVVAIVSLGGYSYHKNKTMQEQAALEERAANDSLRSEIDVLVKAADASLAVGDRHDEGYERHYIDAYKAYADALALAGKMTAGKPDTKAVAQSQGKAKDALTKAKGELEAKAKSFEADGMGDIAAEFHARVKKITEALKYNP